MLIEYEQLLYYKGFMGQCQYIFGSVLGAPTARSGLGRPEEMVNGEL